MTFSGNIFYNGTFRPGNFEVKQGMFADVKAQEGEAVTDATYIIPGLIDIHTHSCMGYDFSDGDPSAMEPMARFYASHGVTSWCPTSMTLPYETLSKAFAIAMDHADREMTSPAARVAGINMEGPYFSMKNAISYGILADTAIKAATINPAVSIGKDDAIGSIDNKKKADFIICDDKLDLQEVYIGGTLFK